MIYRDPQTESAVFGPREKPVPVWWVIYALKYLEIDPECIQELAKELGDYKPSPKEIVACMDYYDAHTYEIEAECIVAQFILKEKAV